MFSIYNKTGCRYVLVDAMNTEPTLNYYERNDFKLLFPRAKNEREFYRLKDEDKLKTRMYYFDLLLLK